MLIVYTQECCPYSDGQDYVPVGEAIKWKGEVYTLYAPCQMREGTSERGILNSLPDFIEMLRDALCKRDHTSYRGGMNFSAGDMGDEFREFCLRD